MICGYRASTTPNPEVLFFPPATTSKTADMRPATEKIAFIDFARGYAIFTIVLYHAAQKAGLPPWAMQVASFGGTGVHLFFLLSGFGLALSRSSGSAATFYRRRLVKVWLPYVLALSLSWLAAACCGLFPDGAGAWLAGVLLYQMFYEPYILSFGGHFWFISAIVQFYLAWPFLTKLRQRLSDDRVFLALSLVVSAGWWLLVFALEKGALRTWNSFFLQFLWEFALGMALAGLFQRGSKAGAFWRFPLLWNLAAAIVFTGLMLVMVVKMGPAGRIFNDIPALIGYTAICISIYQLAEKALPPLRRFFVWTGGISYSLYLIHVLVLDFYVKMLDSGGLKINPATLSLYPLAALGAAWLFEQLSGQLVRLFSTKEKTLARLDEDAAQAPDSATQADKK